MSGASLWARLRRLSSLAIGLPDLVERRSRGLEEIGQRLVRVEKAVVALTARADASLPDGVEARARQLALQVDELAALLRVTEERTRHLARQLDDSMALLRITEARTRTLLDHEIRAGLTADFLLSQQHRSYVEAAERAAVRERPAVVAARSLVLEATATIATDSADHRAPASTEEGVVRPTGFVLHCRDLLGGDLACLDLGTGGAGLVYEFVMQDVLAIGLDGSDHNRRHGLGYWPLLPDNLHTCDITRPFAFRDAGGGRRRFPLLTSWEVLEHIPEERVPGLLANVRGNLAPGGWFVGSISLREYLGPGGEPYHVTLRPRDWWAARFAEAGLEMRDAHPFDVRRFPRGNGPRFQDFHDYLSTPEDGFHFVARHRGAE